MTGNLLFLFSPSEKWTYCGGATLICAEALEEAIAIANGAEEGVIIEGGTFYAAEKDIPPNPAYGCPPHAWVLRDTFALQFPREKGIVFTDSNYT